MPPSANIGEFKLEDAAEREHRRIQVGGCRRAPRLKLLMRGDQGRDQRCGPWSDPESGTHRGCATPVRCAAKLEVPPSATLGEFKLERAAERYV
jgi:hypothetical protein